MMTEINHATYKTWSGGAARGGPPFKDPVDPKRHADRAVWLAGQLEAPSWGVCQNYDGCAMSAGILNNIAVSPRDNSQGSLFALMHRVFIAAPTTSAKLISALAQSGWTVAEDGVLRSKATGKSVRGIDIRNQFSPPGGHVPAAGPAWEQAKVWLTLFHELLSDPSTFAAQSAYAVSWLAAGAQDVEMGEYRLHVDPHLDTWIGLRSDQMEPHFEMAMCVYHAFSVNAPGAARYFIVDEPGDADVVEWSKGLITSFSKSTYGHWHGKGGRYDRTRHAVWSRPDLWDSAMAHELMPDNQPSEP